MLAIALLPGVVRAEGGNAVSPWFYFSKPGLPREQVLADLDECSELAGVVQPPRADGVYTPDPIGAATVGFLQGMQRGEQRRNMIGAAYRKCMALKGYARIAMSKDEAKTLYAGSADERRARIADLALQPSQKPRLDP